MKEAVKILALLFIAALLVLNGWFYLAGMVVEHTILSSDYYRKLNQKIGFVDQIYDAALAEMKEELSAEIPPGTAEKIREKFLESFDEIFLDAFPREWFEDNLLFALDDCLSFIKGEEDVLTFVFDQRENKMRLEETLRTIPDQLALDFPKDSEPPLEFGIDVAIEGIMQELELQNNQVTLAELLEEDLSSPETMETIDWLQFYRRIVLRLPYLIWAIFLVLNCLLAGFSGGLKWFGAAAVFAGSTLLVPLQLFRFMFTSGFRAMVETDLPLSAETFVSATAYTFSRASLISVSFAIIGLFFLAAGIIIGKNAAQNRNYYV